MGYKEKTEIQEGRREWLEEIAEDIEELRMLISNKLVNSKEINLSEIEEIYKKSFPIGYEIEKLFKMLKEEKVTDGILTDLNNNKITIEEACVELKMYDKKSVEKMLTVFRKN
jgi:methyl coenzyme M reductase subunit D